MKLAIYSGGIRDINGLEAFLPEYELVFREKAEAIAGWGIKHTSAKAMKVAREGNLPYIALEDAFLRSYGLGIHGSTPFSMVADDLGIYYDATRQSRLEVMIAENSAELLESGIIARAEAAINEIRQQRLSKYNNSLEKWALPKGRYVLVVDQCAGDYSVKYGLADNTNFREMLAKAREENEGARIIIKIHPDVLAGKEEGYLKGLAWKDDVLLTENINPHILFENVEKVYTVTSLMGMEAMLCGKPVRCFGMPFYAGWGATEDEINLGRRSAKRSATEIFAAAYIKYSRYIDPYLKAPSDIENCIDNLAFIKKYYAGHRKNYYCTGFSGWKRGFISPYIKSASNKVEYFRSPASAIKATKNAADSALMVWAGREKPVVREQAGKLPVYRMEDGFIRSAGLGSDLIAANSLIIDKTGIHFDSSRPSDIENLLNTKDFSPEELQRARKLLDEVIKNSISKYNLAGEPELLKAPEGKTKILVVGQVEGDASIRFGAGLVKTNQALINKVREAHRDAYIIFKPHPDIVSGNRKGDMEERGMDLLVTDTPISQLIKQVDEVHVITSHAGFEAIMLGKKVVCHGVPFYHGWGLTSGDSVPRRTRKRSALELFAAAIIDYPSYYDFSVNLPCRPEIIVSKIAGKILTQKKKRKYTRVFNWVSMSLKN